jgi:hypothetical protein
MLGTGWFLAHLRSFQKLGQPGVKVVSEPTYSESGATVNPESVYLPAQVMDFQSERIPVAAEVQDWLPQDTTYGQRVYRAPDGFQAWVNVILMGSDRTSIHKPEYCLTGQGWQISTPTPDVIPMSRPHSYDLPVMKIEASRSFPGRDGVPQPMKAMMVFWFVADQQLTAEHNERMRWMARDMIFGGVLQRWAYVSCFVVCYPGQETAAYQRLTGLIAELVPQFQLATGPTRSVASAK